MGLRLPVAVVSSRLELTDEGIYVRVDNKIGSSSVRDAIKGVQRILTSKGAALFGEQHSTVAPALWLRSAGQLILFERWTGSTWARVGSLSNAGVLDVVAGGNFTIAGTPVAGGSGTPASTVTSETTYGISPAVGVDTEYARQDHTHGSPTTPSIPSASGTVAAETSFGVSSNAGAAATFSRGDHTHGTPAAPAAARTVTFARARVTSGDITLPDTSAAWALLSTGSIPELTVAATVGDVVEISLHCLTSATSNNYFDVVNVSGGGPTIVRYMATATSTPALEGNPAYYPSLAPITAVQSFTTVSGDIDGGNVRFRIATLSAGARTLFASTNYPFYWQAKVYPQ